MRFLFTVLVPAIAFSSLSAQIDLSDAQWQEDIRYLQHTVRNEYDHLFRKVTREEWDSAVEDLRVAVPELDDHEVVVGIAELVAKFGYGHTALWLTSWRYNRTVSFHQMPYNLYWFTDGIFVQGVHEDFEEALGARVVRIGNRSIEDAMHAVRPVVSAENDQFFKAHGLHYLGVPEILHAKGIIDDTTFVELGLEKGGREFAVRFTSRPTERLPGYYGLIQTGDGWLDARPSTDTPNWLKHLEKKYYFEYLEPHNMVYVRQSEIQDDESEDIPTFYGRLFDFIDENDVEKLVLDLRLNSGGNNYKNKEVVTGLIKSDKVNRPGRLFVILGRRTFSACQNLVNEIENYTNATFVGEPTAENVNFFGDTRTVRLPNSNLPVRLSYLWWQDKDPRDDREWTPPHIAIEMSSSDYMSNRDPVLEAVLSSEPEDVTLDPWDHLVDLFSQGKMDELHTTTRAFVKDPRYRFFDFEDRINQAGYQLLGDERIDDALMVFGLNAELYPDSPNVWDSLAEANWRNSDTTTAKELYNKAIEMDPDGPIGDNAREMLKRMREKTKNDSDF